MGIIHIHTGDCAAMMGRQLFPGEHLVWTDLLFEGPLPHASWDSDTWLQARAMAMAPHLGNAGRAARLMSSKYKRIHEALATADEVTLWFDSCLYDMMLLAEFFTFMHPAIPTQATVYLLCEEKRANGSRFAGYGELSLEEMSEIYQRRQKVTAEHVEEALAAWEAFTSDTPDAWLKLYQAPSDLYPYMAPAAQRLLEQLSCQYSGLNRLEKEIMEVVLDGCSTLCPLFARVSQAEERPYFGDNIIWQALNRMSQAREPLLRLQGPYPEIPINVLPDTDVPQFHPEDWLVTGTLAGMRSLWGFGQLPGGYYDNVRWLGNVRLAPDSDWRWNRWEHTVCRLK